MKTKKSNCYSNYSSYNDIIIFEDILLEYDIKPIVSSPTCLYFNIKNQGYQLLYSKNNIGINLFPVPFGGVNYFSQGVIQFRQTIEKLGAKEKNKNRSIKYVKCVAGGTKCGIGGAK